MTSFFEEADRIVAALTPRCPEDLRLVKRLVHTLKGNAALYGLTSVAEHCHAIEDSMVESQSAPSAALVAELHERWSRLAESPVLLVRAPM